jgi:hypothetical protein
MAPKRDGCQTAESCFATIDTRWYLQLLDAKAIVPGTYTFSSGLNGNDLYLFADRTFIHSDWADGDPGERGPFGNPTYRA